MKFFQRKKKTSGLFCPTCGHSHEGQPTNLGFLLPDVIFQLDDEERQKHLDYSSEVAFLEDKTYIRGVLQVPFTFSDNCFGWGIWAEISAQTYEEFLAHYENDSPRTDRFPGFAANSTVANPDLLGTPLEVEFGAIELRPLFFLPADSQHPLANEQHNGIDANRYHEILSLILGE